VTEPPQADLFARREQILAVATPRRVRRFTGHSYSDETLACQPAAGVHTEKRDVFGLHIRDVDRAAVGGDGDGGAGADNAASTATGREIGEQFPPRLHGSATRDVNQVTNSVAERAARSVRHPSHQVLRWWRQRSCRPARLMRRELELPRSFN